MLGLILVNCKVVKLFDVEQLLNNCRTVRKLLLQRCSYLYEDFVSNGFLCRALEQKNQS